MEMELLIWIIGSSNSAAYGYKAYVVFGQTGTSTTSVDVTNSWSKMGFINSKVIQNRLLGVRTVQLRMLEI